MAERCGTAARLSSQHGAGRSAAMSKAFHAMCAESPESFRLMASLAPIEKEEVGTWKMPATVKVNDWCELDYDSATKEQEVGLDWMGEFADTEADSITWGHLDFAWLRTIEDLKVAFVADIKKSVWTTPDGPDSLQIHAYGRAFAKKVGASAYVTGIWAAKEGKWLWDTEIIHLDGEKAREIWGRIAYAAENEGEASTGSHCGQCYARLHCPEYLLPAVVTTALVKECTIDGTLVEGAEEARQLLAWADRAEDLAERVKKNLRELVRRGEFVITDDEGKVWGPVEMLGRESVDMAKLKALPDGSTVIKRGESYEQFRWRKAR
jgi:hypothetical protein